MNSFVKRYREQFPNDKTDEAELTLRLGDEWMSHPESAAQITSQYPDFAKEYKDLQRFKAKAARPGILTEVGRGFDMGMAGLASTAAGAGAMAAEGVNKVTGTHWADPARNYLLKKAHEIDTKAAASSAPSVKNFRDIEDASDFAYWTAHGGGSVAPSVIEGAVTTTAGALIGSATAGPGGTLVGAGMGLVERAAVKSLIKKFVKKEVQDLVAGEIKDVVAGKLERSAVSAATKELIDIAEEKVAKYGTKLGHEVSSVNAKYGGNMSTAVNSYAQSAGEVFNELVSVDENGKFKSNVGGDPDKAFNIAMTGAGFSALPDTFVPSYIAGKFLKGVEGPALKEAKKHWYSYLARVVQEGAKTMPAEAITEGFQELVNIAAARYGSPKSDTPWTKEETDRIINAAGIGAIGGAMGAPIAAIPNPHATTTPPVPYVPEVPGNERQATPEELAEHFGDVAGPPLPPAEAVPGETQATPEELAAPAPPAPAPAPGVAPVPVPTGTPQLTPEQQAKSASGLVRKDGLPVGSPPDPVAQVPIPTAPVPAGGVDGPLPGWMQQNSQAVAKSLAPEVAQKIGDLAAQRRTAKEIAAEIGMDEETVRYARMGLGIPSQTLVPGLGGGTLGNPEFEAWLQKRQAASAPATSPLVAQIPIPVAPPAGPASTQTDAEMLAAADATLAAAAGPAPAAAPAELGGWANRAGSGNQVVPPPVVQPPAAPAPVVPPPVVPPVAPAPAAPATPVEPLHPEIVEAWKGWLDKSHPEARTVLDAALAKHGTKFGDAYDQYMSGAMGINPASPAVAPVPIPDAPVTPAAIPPAPAPVPPATAAPVVSDDDAKAKRVAALPVRYNYLGWDIAKDGEDWILRDPNTKKETARGLLADVRAAAIAKKVPTPAAPVEEKKEAAPAPPAEPETPPETQAGQSLVGNLKDGYKVVGGERFPAGDRLAHANKARATLQVEADTLRNRRVAYASTREVQAKAAEKKNRLAEIKASVNAWSVEIDSAEKAKIKEESPASPVSAPVAPAKPAEDNAPSRMSVMDFVNVVGFNTAAVVPGEPGVGKKNHVAYQDLTKPDPVSNRTPLEVLYDGAKGGSVKGKSNNDTTKMGVYQDATGRVVIGVAFKSGSPYEEKFTTLWPSDKVAGDWRTSASAEGYVTTPGRMEKDGFKLISSITTEKVNHGGSGGFAVTFNPNEWSELQEILERMGGAGARTAAAVTAAMKPTDELPASKGGDKGLKEAQAQTDEEKKKYEADIEKNTGIVEQNGFGLNEAKTLMAEAGFKPGDSFANVETALVHAGESKASRLIVVALLTKIGNKYFNELKFSKRLSAAASKAPELIHEILSNGNDSAAFAQSLITALEAGPVPATKTDSGSSANRPATESGTGTKSATETKPDNKTETGVGKTGKAVDSEAAAIVAGVKAVMEDPAVEAAVQAYLKAESGEGGHVDLDTFRNAELELEDALGGSDLDPFTIAKVIRREDRYADPRLWSEPEATETAAEKATREAAERGSKNIAVSPATFMQDDADLNKSVPLEFQNPLGFPKLNPETMIKMVRVGVFHLETMMREGVAKFSDWAKLMLTQFDKMRRGLAKYLDAIYNEARKFLRESTGTEPAMEDEAAVQKSYETILAQETNQPGSSPAQVPERTGTGSDGATSPAGNTGRQPGVEGSPEGRAGDSVGSGPSKSALPKSVPGSQHDLGRPAPVGTEAVDPGARSGDDGRTSPAAPSERDAHPGAEFGHPKRPALRTASEYLIPKPSWELPLDAYPIMDKVQRLAVNLIVSRVLAGGDFMLADGPGVGKTIVEIVAAIEIGKLKGKPVLIITQGNAVMTNNFPDDARKIGVIPPASKPKPGATPLQAAKAAGIEAIAQFKALGIELATYTMLSSERAGLGEYGLVIFDEAHNLKNPDSAKSNAAFGIKTDSTVFATATAMDNPLAGIYFFAQITGESQANIADRLGYNVTVNKEGKREAKLKQGRTKADADDHIIILRDSAIRRGSMIRREYPFFGKMEKLTLPMTEEHRQEQMRIFNYWQDLMDGSPPHLKMMYSGQRTGEMSRWQEATKVDAIISRMMVDIKEGKSVIVFAEGVNDTWVKGLGEWRPGFLKDMAAKLESLAAGLPPDMAKKLRFAKVFGEGPEGHKALAIREFQRTDKDRVLIALMTPESGGTGINADDQKGNSPRVAYFASVDFSGDVFEQQVGRASRRNTQSPVSMHIVQVSNSFSDDRREQIINEKLKILHAINQGGDMDRVSLSGQTIVKGPNRAAPVGKPTGGAKLEIRPMPGRPGLLLVADLVKGATYKNKDTIKEVGRRFGKTVSYQRIEGQEGWVFPATLEAEMRKELADLLGDSSNDGASRSDLNDIAKYLRHHYDSEDGYANALNNAADRAVVAGLSLGRGMDFADLLDEALRGYLNFDSTEAAIKFVIDKYAAPDRPKLSQPAPRSLPTKEGDAQLLSNLQGAAVRGGLNWQVLQEDMSKAADAFMKQAGAAYEEARRVVFQVVGAVIGQGDVHAAIHDISHHVFAKLPQEQRDDIRAAVESVGDDQLGLHESPDPRFANDFPEQWDRLDRAEERATEAVTLRLRAANFDPATAGGLAKQLVRAVKELFMKALMAIQKSRFGPGFVSSELALNFYQNSVEQFLAGDKRRQSFLQWLGGAKPTHAETARFHSNGHPLFEKINGKGEFEYYHVPNTSIEAFEFNLGNKLRYSAPVSPTGKPYKRTVAVEQAAALANQHKACLVGIAKAPGMEQVADLVKAYNEARKADDPPSAPITAEEFVRRALKHQTSPEQMLKVCSEQKEDDGSAVVFDPERVTGDFKAQATKDEVMEHELRDAQAFMDQAGTQQAEAARKQANLEAELPDNITDYDESHKQYENRQFIEAKLVKGIKTLWRKLDNITATSSKKLGMIEQYLKQLDPKAVIKDFAPVFQKLFTGSHLIGTKLYDVIEALALEKPGIFELPINEIRDFLKDHPTDFMRRLADTKDKESMALLATIKAFAVKHSNIVINMELRRQDAEFDRGGLVESLIRAKEEKSESLKTAPGKLREAATLKERARVAYRKLANEIKSKRRQIEQAKLTQTIANAAVAVYRREVARLQLAFDIAADYRPTHGSVFNRPTSAECSVDELAANKQTLNLDTADKKNPITSRKEIEQIILEMSEWIAAAEVKGETGSAYRSMKRQRDGLATVKNFRVDLGQTSHFVFELAAGAWGMMLRKAYGTPVAQILEKMSTMFETIKTTYSRKFQSMGETTTRLEHPMLKLLSGYTAGDRQIFLAEHVMNPACDIIEDARDLHEEYHDDEKALNDALINRVISKLRTNEATSLYFNGHEAEWRGPLAEAIEHRYVSGQYAVSLTEKTGVTDTNTKVFNIATGKMESSVRRHRARGPKTFSRKMGANHQKMVRTLRNDGWRTATGLFKTIGAKLNSADTRGEAVAQVNDLFKSNQAKEDFLHAIVESGKRIEAPVESDGTKQPADPAKLAQAWTDTNGEVVAFLEKVHELHGGAKEKRSAYVQGQLEDMASLFRQIDSMASEDTISGQSHSVIGMFTNALINARTIEDMPGKWFEFHSFDTYDAHHTLESIAAQTAFGPEGRDLAKNLDTLRKEVGQDELKLYNKRREFTLANSGKSKKEIAEMLKTEFGPEEYKRLMDASKRLELVQKAADQLSLYFRKDNNPDGAIKVLQQASGTLGGLMVNQVSSALSQMAVMVDIFMTYGISGETFGALKGTLAAFTRNFGGALMQAVGKQMMIDGEAHRNYIELFGRDPAADKRWRTTFAKLEGETMAAKAWRFGNQLMSVGLNPLGSGSEHVVMRPGKVFTMSAMISDKSLIEGGVWRIASHYVARAKAFLKAHPELDVPGLVIDADMLGFGKGFFAAFGRDTFVRFNEDMQRWNMNLADMARESIASPDGQLLSASSMAALNSMGLATISNVSNTATMSMAARNNPLLVFCMPLLAFSWLRGQRAADLIRGMDSDGQYNARAAFHGMAGLGVAALGSLGVAMLVDDYYERILRKKRNLRPVSASPMAILENLNRMGTLGFLGEAANGILNVGQGGDNRMLSVDGRVVAFSSIQTIQKALSSFVNQGWEADYAHVVRPLATAMGGGGLLQYMQIANNALDLDNVESRGTARTNAQNYLRVVGRDMGLDVRSQSGGYSSPTPITPLFTKMEQAVYANDKGDFRAAYKKAVARAKEEGKPDPEDYVQRAFRTRHPLLQVYRTPPSPEEYRTLLGRLSDDGSRDVSEAVRLFNLFGETIGIGAFVGRAKKTKPGSSLGSAAASSLK